MKCGDARTVHSSLRSAPCSSGRSVPYLRAASRVAPTLSRQTRSCGSKGSPPRRKASPIPAEAGFRRAVAVARGLRRATPQPQPPCLPASLPWRSSLVAPSWEAADGGRASPRRAPAPPTARGQRSAREAFPCLIKRESAAIFLGYLARCLCPRAPCGVFAYVFTCRRGRGRGEGGKLGVWWALGGGGGRAAGGSCVRAACLFRARAMRTGPAPTRACAGVAGIREGWGLGGRGGVCHRRRGGHGLNGDCT